MSQSTSPQQEFGPDHALAHPANASEILFEYPHAPGPHLQKLYTLIWKAVDEDYPNASTRVAALLPRGEGKSEGGGVVVPTWLILRFPWIRIAVISKTKDLAAERTAKVVDRVDHYASHFGIELEKPLPGTELDTTENSQKESTIAPYGLESQLTGKHFDVIIWDDIADWENQRTDTQRRNVRSYFRDYEKNLPDGDTDLPNGPVQLMIGTRKHPLDLYETDILLSHRWNTMVHKAIAEEDWPLVENRDWKVRGTDGKIYDDVGDLPSGVNVAPDGVIPNRDVTVIWPEHRSPESVLYDLVDSEDSTAIWRRENQQDPEALSGEVFESDWLVYEESLPKPPSSYRWVAGADVGVVEDLQEAAQGDSDFSALGIIAEDRQNEGEAYLCGLYHERGMSVKQTADWALDHLEMFARADDRHDGPTLADVVDDTLVDDVGLENPHTLYSEIQVEANKAPGVAQRMRDSSRYPAVPVQSTTGKEGRIHDLGAKFEAAELRIIGDPNADRWRTFETKEWLQFPNAAHDDRLDAIELAMRVIESGGQSEFSTSDHSFSDIF